MIVDHSTAYSTATVMCGSRSVILQISQGFASVFRPSRTSTMCVIFPIPSFTNVAVASTVGLRKKTVSDSGKSSNLASPAGWAMRVVPFAGDGHDCFVVDLVAASIFVAKVFGSILASLWAIGLVFFKPDLPVIR